MRAYDPFNPKPKAKKKPTSEVAFKRAPKGERTFWSDNERLAALAAIDSNGGNIHATARELGIPYTTLYSWTLGERYPEGRRLRDEANGKLADVMESVVYQTLALLPGKLDAAPLNHMTGVVDKLTEKMRLIRGESTSNNENRNQQVNPEIADLLSKATPDEREQLRTLLLGIAQRESPRLVGEEADDDGVTGELGSGGRDRE